MKELCRNLDIPYRVVSSIEDWRSDRGHQLTLVIVRQPSPLEHQHNALRLKSLKKLNIFSLVSNGEIILFSDRHAFTFGGFNTKRGILNT